MFTLLRRKRVTVSSIWTLFISCTCTLLTRQTGDTVTKEFNTGSASWALCQQSINRSINPRIPGKLDVVTLTLDHMVAFTVTIHFHILSFPVTSFVTLALYYPLAPWTNFLSSALVCICLFSSHCHSTASDVRVLLPPMMLCKQFQVSEVFIWQSYPCSLQNAGGL